MELKKFDYDFMYKINLEMVHGMYKNKSEDFYHKEALKMTKAAKSEYINANMGKKLQECGFGKTESGRKAKNFVSWLPEELYPNIIEWIEGKPISDIDYHGMSIKKIMEQNKGSTFIKSLYAMHAYIDSGYKKSVIYQFFIWDGHG